MGHAKEQKGFTLIELLIVVCIIGILGAIAVPAYIGSQEKARKSNLEKAAGSSESDIAHWLESANKGFVATNPGAILIEVDTDWDGAVTNADLTNIQIFNFLGSADTSVANRYAAARSAELSPWQGLGGCGVTTLFTYNAAAPAAAAPGLPCTVQLSPAANSPGNLVSITATSNGPGGSSTANAELLVSALASSG